MFQAESQNLRTQGKCRTLKPGVCDAGLAMEQHRGQGCGWVDKRQVGRLGGWGDSQGLASNFRASPSNWEPLLSFYSLLSPPWPVHPGGKAPSPRPGLEGECSIDDNCVHFFLFVFFFQFWFFNWHIVDIQCCITFCCTAKWFNHTYIYAFFFIYSFPFSKSQEC